MGTACHVRGAPRLLEQLERDTGLSSGGTAADLSLTVEEVNCVGACALGPLVLIDGDYHGHMTADNLSRLIDKLLAKEEQQ
jgi:NADH:ubiquinone oxidoreductase subunit E